MKYQIFAIRDIKSATYIASIRLQINAAVACREISDLTINNLSSSIEENPFRAHPEDYELYNIGTYDIETGQIEARMPEFVINLANLKKDLAN